jgi:hypothetical protein
LIGGEETSTDSKVPSPSIVYPYVLYKNMWFYAVYVMIEVMLGLSVGLWLRGSIQSVEPPSSCFLFNYEKGMSEYTCM